MFSKKNLIFLIPLLFFTLQFLLRVIPGIFNEGIIEHFSMNASEFGFFSSIYYLGYAGMQIPIGILLDIFQLRKIISILIFLCALAAIGLTLTDNWVIASFYRFIIGLASVAGYIGCVKVAKEIYPLKLYNKMISLTFSVGFIGAAICFIISGKGLEDKNEWKNILFMTSIILTIISILAFFCLAEKNKTYAKQNFIKNLKIILKNKPVIITSLAGGLMIGVCEGFGDVWGNSFLKLAYNITDFQSVTAASFIYLGVGVGAPIITLIADKIDNHPLVTIVTGLLMLILFIFVLAGNLNYYVLLTTCFIIGLLSANQVLIFTMNTMKVNQEVIGLTAAVTNSFVMGFGVFFHSIIGYLMDYFWDGATLNDHRVYSLKDYKIALSIIPIACLVGSGVIFLINKKRLLKN